VSTAKRSTTKPSTAKTTTRAQAKTRAPRAKSKKNGVYRLEVPKGLNLSDEQIVELYEYMKLNRMLEERLGHLYRQNHIVGGLYSSLGQEATSIGTAYALKDGDRLAPMIRNLGSYLVRGVSCRDFVSQYLAKGCSPTQGKDGTAHFGDPAHGLIGCISMLGALIPVMAGVALVMKQKKMPNVALTYIGDGGTSTTDFHEGVNFAAVHKLPFILVMEHNLWAYSTHTSKQFSVKDLAEKGPSYGVYSEIFDGNNIFAAYDATRRAREMCVAGEGPVLLESKTFRRKGHAEHDPAGYVPKEMRAEWEKRDPMDAFVRFLSEEEILSSADMEEISARIQKQLDEDVDFVVNSPFPEADIAHERYVYRTNDNDGGTT